MSDIKVTDDAVEAAHDVLMGSHLRVRFEQATTREVTREALAAALPHLRMVPEDDEDTVRVPESAIQRLNTAWENGDRDLGDAVDQFLEAVPGINDVIGGERR